MTENEFPFEPDYSIDETLVRKNYFRWAKALNKIAKHKMLRGQAFAEAYYDLVHIAQKALEEEC